MKYLLMGILFLFMNAPVQAQSITDSVTVALNKADAKALAVYFYTSIDLEISQRAYVYSKAQAEQIIADFFKANQPEIYKQEHTGTNKSGQIFMTGTLTTHTGNFKVSITIAGAEEKQFIHSIQFED